MSLLLICLVLLSPKGLDAQSDLQLTKCQVDVLKMHAQGARQQFIPKCTLKGQYNPRQCNANEGVCWCVDDQGKEVDSTRKGLKEWIPCAGEPANPTRCQADFARASATSLAGVYVPQCDEDGQYTPVQCHQTTGHCWCVTTEGHVISGTETGADEDQPSCAKEPTPCQVAVQNTNSQAGGLVGAYVPQCNGMGEYEPRQCHGSTGYCWCVDANGNEIDGTRRGPGTPVTCGPCDGNTCQESGACHTVDGKCACFNGATPPACDPCDGKFCTFFDHCSTSLQFLGHCSCTNDGALDDCTPGPCNGLACQLAGTCETQGNACVCLNGAAPPDCLPQTCEAAWPLTCDSWDINQQWLNTTSATLQGAYSCGTVQHTAPQGWYSLTLESETSVQFFQCTAPGFQSRISVFSGNCSGAQCVAATEAALQGSSAGGSGANHAGGLTCGSALTTRLPAGTHHIMVHGIANTVGASTLWATCNPCGGLPCLSTESCFQSGAECLCYNGFSLPACDACAGKGCVAAGTCTSYGGVCSCSNEGLPENDCVILDAPSNDQCANAQPITCGSHVRGTLFHADESASCSRNGPDVWYSLSLPERMTVSITVCQGRNFDSVMSLMQNCGDTTCLIENDDHCGTGSIISGQLDRGTYQVMVRGFTGRRGNFSFNLDVICLSPNVDPCTQYDCHQSGACSADGARCICSNGAQPPYCDPCTPKPCFQTGTCRPRGHACLCVNGGVGPDCHIAVVGPPSNDECVNAIPLTCGSQMEGTNVNANPSSGNMGLDVWYSLTLTDTTQVTFSICEVFTFDPYLTLNNDNCASPTRIAFNDDYCGKGPSITRRLTPGKYNVAVRGFRNLTGTFRLDVDCGQNRRLRDADADAGADKVEMAAKDGHAYGSWQTWGLALCGLALVQAVVAAVWWFRHQSMSDETPSDASPGVERTDSLHSVVADTGNILRRRSGC